MPTLARSAACSALLLVCALPATRGDAQKQQPVPPHIPPEHAHFRITLLGFVVHAPTLDTALGLDGSGDEVSVRAETMEIDTGRPYVRRSQHLETAVMGDTHNPEFRILTGTASPTGGLTSNDEAPRPTSLPAPSDPDHVHLPLVVFDGELTRGQNAVLVIPSLWEWDGPNSLKARYYSNVLSWSSNFLYRAVDQLRHGGRSESTDFDGRVLVETPGVERPIPNILQAPADRPIGMSQNAGYESFAAQAYLFTYDAASFAATQNRTGRGNGVFELHYDDGGSLLGSYSLFMIVQRIP